jgi:hypothetical protein
LAPLLNLINNQATPDEIVLQRFSGLDIMDLVATDLLACEKKAEWLMAFHQIRRDVRNESVLVWMMLHTLARVGQIETTPP